MSFDPSGNNMLGLPEQGRFLLLFDGICNLCNRWVTFVLARDSKAAFTFGTLQSDAAKEILARHGLPKDYSGSLVFISSSGVFLESDAALKALAALPDWLSLCAGFLILPKFIRDPVYRYIARNRYRWFGKKDSCMVPSAEMKARFL